MANHHQSPDLCAEAIKAVRVEECARLIKAVQMMEGIVTAVQIAHGILEHPPPVIPGEGTLDPSTELMFESMVEWGITDVMVLRRSILSEIDEEIVRLAYRQLAQEGFGVNFAEVAPHTTKWMNARQEDSF